MRRVLMGDVIAAARVLKGVARGRRPAVLRDLLRAADAAERHRSTTGRAHPALGNGSLMGAAHRHAPGPEPFLDDIAYLEALIPVLTRLRHRCRAGTAPDPQPRAQSMQRGVAGSCSSRAGAISSPQESQ